MSEVAPGLPQSSFSTDMVAPEHRFEAWRAALSSSHAVEADPSGFFGRIQSVQAENLLVHRLDSSPVALERSPGRIRQDGLDHVILHMSRHPIRATAADRTLEIPGCSISLNDLSRPMTRQPIPETASLVAILPRMLVREAVGDCDRLHGQVLPPGGAALVSAHLRNLVENGGAVSPESGSSLARATAHLLAACLNPTTRSLGEAAPAIEAAKLARARTFIEANLSRADLTPAIVGRAVGLSRSALFRAFEPIGGVSAYLWSRRLVAVHRALRDPADVRPIGRLGYDYGFTSAAHLSRAFRKEFGHSPREFRRAAHDG